MYIKLCKQHFKTVYECGNCVCDNIELANTNQANESLFNLGIKLIGSIINIIIIKLQLTH